MARKVALVVIMVCGLGMIANAAYPGWSNQRIFERWILVGIGVGLILVAINQLLALRKAEGGNRNNG